LPVGKNDQEISHQATGFKSAKYLALAFFVKWHTCPRMSGKDLPDGEKLIDIYIQFFVYIYHNMFQLQTKDCENFRI
jgi:hypothetical protein